jgi:hypothetical protein
MTGGRGLAEQQNRLKGASSIVATWAVIALCMPYAARALVAAGEWRKPCEIALSALYTAIAMFGAVWYAPGVAKHWWPEFWKAHPGWSPRLAGIIGYLTFLWFALVTVTLINVTLVDVDLSELRALPGCGAPHGAAAPSQCVGPHGSELFSQTLSTEWIQLLGGVPVLEIPDSLKLTAPLEYTNAWGGVVEMMFKAVVVAHVVGAVRVIWGRSRVS